MDFQLDDAMQLLQRTPAQLDALLRGLPQCWLDAAEGEQTWNPVVIVGHLIHGEMTDWIPRARIILDHGEMRPFDPFDRFAQFNEIQGRSLEDLLDTFTAKRKESLQTLKGFKLTAADYSRRGTHPALGTVTLSQLLSTWVVHDLTHLHQISRVLAHQYADAVGPWTEYLGVLHCRPTS